MLVAELCGRFSENIPEDTGEMVTGGKTGFVSYLFKGFLGVCKPVSCFPNTHTGQVSVRGHARFALKGLGQSPNA